LAKMKRDGVAVEICLTSNHSILGVDGRAHPFKLYRSAGVPVFLNTDDEGVSRSNLTSEYVRAVREQGVGYADLKEMARNSIEYSFLGGQGLYEGRDFARLRPEFSNVRRRGWTASPTEKRLMSRYPKLAVEVRLERSFYEFESQY
jgi:adenosine deaminase